MNPQQGKSAKRPVKTMLTRHVYFLLSVVIASALAVPPLVALFRISYRSDYYSHIPLIPLVSVYLLYQQRKTLFDDAEYGLRWGSLVAAAGLFLYAAGMWNPGLNLHDASSLMVFSSLLFLFGSIVLLYGTRVFRRSIFPLLFLLFMVPIPSGLMDRIIYFLQVGSAEVTDMIFKATGIPYLREGLVFHLPGFSIEVAKECSGIRSSLALVITATLAGHFLLQAYWQKAVLTLSLLPIVLIKNGIRISVLTFLGAYVDLRILTQGFLHKSGGVFFFIPALGLMGIIICLLRRLDRDSTLNCHNAKSLESIKLGGSAHLAADNGQSAVPSAPSALPPTPCAMPYAPSAKSADS